MRVFTRIMALTIAATLLFASCAMAETEGFKNPLINPQPIEYIDVSGDIINILLLGIDFGHKGYWGSGSKKVLENCHTDAVMVVAVDLKNKTVDFVSLPRDTVTYVPGVKGIYKLNAAFNCGKDVQDGLKKACEAASWVLGGIRIDYYFAVDMNAMTAIGDEMGGVDFELEMAYKGHSGKRYRKGMQHLDGTGITDYLRARKNATIRSNDIGRTGRQRDLMQDIYEKLKNDRELLMKTITYARGLTGGYFTNIGDVPVELIAKLLPLALGLDENSIGSYVLTGPYRSSNTWNFTFTDQENRQAVIKEVWGVDVPPIPYVDRGYMTWLKSSGFLTVRYLHVADELRTFISGLDASGMTPEQKEAIEAFEKAYQETGRAFDVAADTLKKADRYAMEKARKDLRKFGDKAAKLLKYEKKMYWNSNLRFSDDRMINEMKVDWR